MGDRNNPIKFGPEWLRNLSQEQATTRANNSAASPSPARPTGSQPGGSTQVSGSMASSPPTRGVTQRPRGGGTTGAGMGRATSTTGASGINTRNTNHYQVPRVLLASLRYGREEMLALYDRNSEAPDDLKHFDVLYQPRGKPPAALNNYEDENRDRGGVGGAGDRFSAGRGANMRGGANDARLKMRSPYTRAPAGRGMTAAGNPRMPYTGEEEASTSRAWSASNGAGVQRPPTEQTDWSKMFRRRQTNNTNWRQQTARDEEEWRQDSARALPRNNTDKWDREWGDRPTDRPQNWNANRRRGGDEDNLPEWAVDSTEEGGAGTFDSTGAFHGCSNDDSSLSRTQDPPYELTRSHTHGSFAPRKSSIEEGSDEWWASEKAKKLSPKRFDTDMRFKRSQSANAAEPVPSTSKSHEEPEKKNQVKAEPSFTTDVTEKKYPNTQTFENPTKSDEREDYNDTEEQLFTSVIITKNNSLRQKHQNRLKLSDIPRSALNKIPIPPLDSTSSETPDDLENSSLISYLNDLDGMEQLTETSESTQNSTSNLAMMINSTNNGMNNPMNNAINNPSPIPAPMQNIGMSNSALNSSLGLPIGASSNSMGMSMQGMPSVMQNTQLNNMANPIGSTMPSRSLLGGFHTNNGIPVIQNQPNATSSLFMNQNSPQQPISSTTDQMSNVSQNPMYPMLGLQHSSSQVGFRSMYGNAMPNIPNTPNPNNLAEQWFYEDPNKTIQGPFTSHDMYNWYRAGFFNSSLMVRRGCDTHLRPLGSYGPIVPFAPHAMNMMSQFGMSGFDARTPANEMLNPQPSLGIDVGRDTLWSQPTTSRDMLWMQQPVNNARNESSVNNLPVYFWDQQPTSAISSNSLLPEDIAKEMKTEDQILAQLRANQTIPTAQPFVTESPTPTSIITSDDFANAVKATPDLEELQKLIQNESLLAPPPQVKTGPPEIEVKEKPKPKPTSITDVTKPPPQVQKITETKQAKPTKPEADKATKNKENAATKTKNKKNKEDKKEDAVEVKKEEEKVEKRSAESSPSKCKKEEKPSKKELEREKKEWVKEGFTIVKGPEKSVIKENKKKLEEMRAQEEVERKKKEEERLAVEEEKKRRNMEAAKKPQEPQPKPIETLIKKAPWSATQAVSMNKDGLTLAEIQRLEREKKLEQMREQQQMMQIIAQQQAAAVAREQEMQAAVGWAKKKTSNNTQGQSLAEIQAETKRQAAAAAAAATAAAAAAAVEEAQVAAPPTTNHAPWANTHNGGFWDPQPNVAQPKQEKPAEPPKPAEPAKPKKKPAVAATNKKETTPAAEFEVWCNNMLASWSYKIDVPTFVGFLKDIESPYEVKDYIKCYLDESKDSNDFARQFLERRSKLLRVGMVTPSDDLCSPAMAINPRNSGSDYQEVKGKGKKTKKNKMLKVDARILGFSVTASEDRINVGDIDTA